MCWSYNRQYGTKYLAAMPTNLYGPGDNYSLMNSHVIPAMIRKFHLAKLAAEKNWPAIEQDEIIHGPIPEDLKQELLAACNLNLASAVRLWGTGTPKREFLYSDDMADACVFLMNLPDDKYELLLWPAGDPIESCNLGLAPVVNIGVGEDVSIKELAATVRDVVGFEGEIVFDTSKPDGTPRKLMDVGRLNGIGWRAESVLSQGLQVAYSGYSEENC